MGSDDSVKSNDFLELTGISLLEGRYRLQQEITGGKSSTSYFGIDEVTGAEIFVKLCIFPRSRLERARFKNEIDFLKRNAFFNTLIKKTPDYLSDGELFEGKILYLVTERIHGTLLSEWFEDHYGDRSLRDRLLVAYRVLGAAENFFMGTTHRDLHVGNIILLDEEVDLYSDVPNFKAIILDWGQSYCRAFYEYSESDDDDMVIIHKGIGREVTNSFYNLPPETFIDWEKSGSEYASYDSWAMGLLLYKLVVGKDLFEFRNIGEYASSLRRVDSFVSWGCLEISREAADAGPILSGILRRLMCKSPFERMRIVDARYALWFILVEGYMPTDPREINEFLESPAYYDGRVWKHFKVEHYDEG